MAILKQRDPRWRYEKLGFGSGSIGDFGCYITALTSGLNKAGYDFTPQSLNQFFKEKKLWIGPYKNYIDVANLHRVLPKIFKSFQKIEPFNNIKTLSGFMNENYIVLGKVNAKGIGGSGTHFVRITKIDGANAIIEDPWHGDELPVVMRYGDWKNILGLRIFWVNPREEASMPTDNIYKGLDLNNPESMKVAVDVWYKTTKEHVLVLKKDLKKLEDESKELSKVKEKLKGFESVKEKDILMLKQQHQTEMEREIKDATLSLNTRNKDLAEEILELEKKVLLGSNDWKNRYTSRKFVLPTVAVIMDFILALFITFGFNPDPTALVTVVTAMHGIVATFVFPQAVIDHKASSKN